jgi:hypothetical protein
MSRALINHAAVMTGSRSVVRDSHSVFMYFIGRAAPVRKT